MNEEVNYLKEHLYEIYQYKKSMKDLTYDMDLEHLLRTCKALDYLQKENNKQKEVLDKIKEKTIQFKDDLKMNEKIAKEQKRSNDISIQLVGLRVNAILELLEEIE